MALVNGAFVHVGQAAALAVRLQRATALAVESAALFHGAARANPSNLHFVATAERAWASMAVRLVAERDGRGFCAPRRQDPVSLRGIPQLLEAWGSATGDYLGEVGHLLFKPSGNPLVKVGCDFPLSQASFLAPALSLRTGAVIEAALLLMWAALGWTRHLLSGRVDGVPRDGATLASPLGLIQAPKLMAAVLEGARMDFGRRTFASGADASSGVEDIWTHGTSTLKQLDGVLDALEEALGMGLWVVRRLADGVGLNWVAQSELLDACAGCATPGEARERVSGVLAEGRPEMAQRLFWSAR